MKFLPMVLGACCQDPGEPMFKGRFFKGDSAAFELGRGTGRKAGLCMRVCPGCPGRCAWTLGVQRGAFGVL